MKFIFCQMYLHACNWIHDYQYAKLLLGKNFCSIRVESVHNKSCIYLLFVTPFKSLVEANFVSSKKNRIKPNQMSYL